MRIHRVQLTAFGPFAGTEVVDLDALSTGGLFLLHGPTGAGKTTVLDAVCFALYGRVPGARGSVSRLRSDHADPAVAPEVVCEFSVGTRRLEITRSPAWERPKKRGNGTTTEQTRVAVRERERDDWRVLTTRADEAGHLLDRMLGLGLDQFTKLVLLPQGDFAAFLRADAEVRRQMLERLFGTDRFTALQQWMRQHQVELRREVETAVSGTELLLAQARQASAPLALPDTTDQPSTSDQPNTDQQPNTAHQPETADLGTTDPVAEISAQQRAARQARENATTRRQSSQKILQQAVEARRHGELLVGLRQEHAHAVERRARLQEDASDQQERRHRIDRAIRAAGLVPVAATLGAATTRADRADRRLATALAEARDRSPLDPAGTVAALDNLDRTETHAGQARQELAGLAEAERDARRLSELDAEAVRHDAALRQAGNHVAQARERVTDLQAQLAAQRERRSAIASVAAREDGVRAGRTAAEAVVTAVRERAVLDEEITAATRTRQSARQARDDARERWLDLRERRLAGIAAELAAGLEPGTACPVCGGREHPRPAAAVPGAEPLDQKTERTAQSRVEEAERQLEAVNGTLAELTHRHAAVSEQAGNLTHAEARQRRDAAVAELAAVMAALAELADADARLTTLAEDLTTWTARREQAEEHLRTASAALAATRELADDVRRRILTAGRGEAVPAARRAALEGWIAALTAVAGARREVAAARGLLADALAEAETAATAAGFQSVAQALDAVCEPAVLEQLQATVRRYDDELAAVTDRLADPALTAAAEQPAPALAELADAEEHARGDDDAAATRVAVCETAVAALGELADRLAAHVHASEPVMRRYRMVEQLSRCLDGTGGDNTRRMSLSAYVLAARLEQVAGAASERLAAMSGGRYTLIHSADRERGRGRSGLSLKVVDEWTSTERETSSLSGGESFYTSLALALGLADVVTAESGGTAVDTLFVDEGFGSLDEDALDEVMDVLDSLRSGGRAVGLVSHVADLRDRIPSRLEVVKTRAGSRLRAATG